MPSITSANSSLVIGVIGLFAVPQPLAGAGTDDFYAVDAVDSAETKMGVDGVLSAGLVYNVSPMNITLQADSDSVGLFEAWYAAQIAAQDVYFAFGVLRQPSVSRTYALARGVLRNYSPLADAKKTLQERKFSIDWAPIVGAPF